MQAVVIVRQTVCLHRVHLQPSSTVNDWRDGCAYTCPSAGKEGPKSSREVLVKQKAFHYVVWMTSGLMSCALSLCLADKQHKAIDLLCNCWTSLLSTSIDEHVSPYMT